MVLKAGHRLTIALAGMVFFTVLFCLPGSDLPQSDFLSKIWFDKWVHIGIFCTIISVWAWAMQLNGYRQLSILIVLAALYGFLIEVVQGNYIPGRSFDLSDLLADVIGCFLGLLLWMKWLQKNRPL